MQPYLLIHSTHESSKKIKKQKSVFVCACKHVHVAPQVEKSSTEAPLAENTSQNAILVMEYQKVTAQVEILG